MQYPSTVARSVRAALITSTIAGAAIATPTFAEETDTAQNVERISVTGSRIKRADMETASPVNVIGADRIEAGSYTSVEQILQESTASAGAAVGSATNNGGRGAARVDLRGMGAERTLVLVNGRRMVVSGTGADASVDLNTIPVSIIERIEVLKDGASAVYGSDAVAGVINIITKTDFEGFQLDGQFGMSDKGDGETGELSALWGTNFDRGNLVLGASYVNRGEVYQDDRFWSNCGPWGDCGGWSSTIPGGSLNWGDGYHTPNADGSWSKQDEYFNYVPYSYLSTPMERYSLNGNFKYEVLTDTNVFVEAMYTRRDSNQQMAPAPITGLYLDTAQLGSGPWDGAETAVYKRRMTEAGPRTFDQTTDTYRVVAGLEGYLDIGNGYDWDISYTFGRNEATSWARNLAITSRVEQSIYDNPEAWLSGEPLSQDILNDVMYDDRSEGGNEMHVFAANLSGELFELPAGSVAFATGAEYRKEEGWFTPDPITQAGESSQSQQDPTQGDYDTTQLYAEFSVPLLSGLRFADEVTMEAAVRWFDYSTFGSDTTWKLGLTWRVNDELMLRGVASTAFRAPSVSELYGGNVGSFDYLTDPCSGVDYSGNSTLATQCRTIGWDDPSQAKEFTQEDSQMEVTWTTDPDLKPEEADTFTAGFVYSPAYADGFSMTVDYWRFEVTNAITRIDRQAYLDACYKQGDMNACEALNISRSSVTGEIETFYAPLVNAGYQETDGVDANFRYAWEYGGHDWTLNWDVTRLLNFKQDGIDYTGTISGMNGGYAEWRQNVQLMVNAQDWTFNYQLRQVGEMVDLVDPQFEVAAAWYHNVSYLYRFSEGFNLTLGINNLFDETPKYHPSYKDVWTTPEVYDVMGRYVYTKFTYQF
ncbi:TonB-dependent receptor plug domain-containing protein [Ferrimonas balearica]|uniref:TonB-dependent receptor plug domain-containing protein n=1 Tax=Ferrimonas balearica TaxID=44012 RepID=UPI001C994B6C|nr:TonB-dependent receptor [Ferrimonas balearica]MBY5921148.1 TonB-dependent receptor [Ferrimonas balearica]MBY5996167.1 TonB-dependent receptor [Ferrimonas balearica]